MMPPTNSPDNLPQKFPPLSVDQFKSTVQLRTAQIVEVDDIPGKDNLYQLTILLGEETRTLVAGIKKWYTKDDLRGKIIAIVANLEPKKLGGVLSQGMLLGALDDEGHFSLLVSERPVKSGTEIR
ncbi:MAG: hypothetical protein Q8P05_01480 [Candidatus Diapherotrites archaeon]|nr:hypothetical protein [Candidatus Diapherotrites archaeon]